MNFLDGYLRKIIPHVHRIRNHSEIGSCRNRILPYRRRIRHRGRGAFFGIVRVRPDIRRLDAFFRVMEPLSRRGTGIGRPHLPAFRHCGQRKIDGIRTRQAGRLFRIGHRERERADHGNRFLRRERERSGRSGTYVVRERAHRRIRPPVGERSSATQCRRLRHRRHPDVHDDARMTQLQQRVLNVPHRKLDEKSRPPKWGGIFIRLTTVFAEGLIFENLFAPTCGRCFMQVGQASSYRSSRRC